MKASLPSAVVVALLSLTACASGDAAVEVRETADQGAGRSVPADSPAASGPVRTRDLVVVLDEGAGPMACLFGAAETLPPQCDGPPVRGWDWSDAAHEERGRVRWGSYAITGSWDGEVLTAAAAIPAALYDAASPEPTPVPTPATRYPGAELARIARALGSGLGGGRDASAGESQVRVDVPYDDGSLQAWADATYGADVVLVRSLLVDTDPPAGLSR